MEINITIKGTNCDACKSLIEEVCGEIKGVKSCTVNFQTGETVVNYDENVDWEKFKKEIEGLGQYKILPSDLTACKECGFVYATAQEAEACERWCTTHHSCNLEITKNSLTK